MRPSPQPAAAARAPKRSRDEDCRCRCGGLVARIVEAGVEIKCRRCKRDLLVPWSAREGWVRPIERPEPAVALRGGSS